MSASLSSSSGRSNNFKKGMIGEDKEYLSGTLSSELGRLEQLKQKEAELAKLLAEVRLEKLSVLRDRPLKIGVMGFGRFGQFIAKSFIKYGNVVGTSRSDYSKIASEMGVFLACDLDVIVLAVSIVSFEDTVRTWGGILKDFVDKQSFQQINAPLIVDVCSVKEHPRDIMLKYLPRECDVLCTHPMFGPDSGKDGWSGLKFVYERTRINGVVLNPDDQRDFHQLSRAEQGDSDVERFLDKSGHGHSLHEGSEGFIEGMDRMERFLSIWEEEGCDMIAMSCKQHDDYAAKSQFITHLMGRILGKQGLEATPIDTKGFQSVLRLIESTTADSFDLFYGLYKYNNNSVDTIVNLKNAMEEVVMKLKELEDEDIAKSPNWRARTTMINYISSLALDNAAQSSNDPCSTAASSEVKIMVNERRVDDNEEGEGRSVLS
eukprot:CAMPEP_0116050134 /NCGR_PEP_ID=MMETSP0322-20121206/200_1 /TAXON_ID=163516 /ORGANISM="Leptocylindrus danicus var. apora, Strain B651" /LENGTH=431 /DNA_ID=CAMNT_0003532627 /DNA_START=151 /DNA_END=1446 /DNA_ORIENTATION=-